MTVRVENEEYQALVLMTNGNNTTEYILRK